MIYVCDTHPLVWFLERNPRLSGVARTAIKSPDGALVVPTIVLAEIWHLSGRGRIKIGLDEIREKILSAVNCRTHSFDEAVLDLMPQGYEIHDAIIVATVRLLSSALDEPVQLITCDERITEGGLVQTVW